MSKNNESRIRAYNLVQAMAGVFKGKHPQRNLLGINGTHKYVGFTLTSDRKNSLDQRQKYNGAPGTITIWEKDLRGYYFADADQTKQSTTRVSPDGQPARNSKGKVPFHALPTYSIHRLLTDTSVSFKIEEDIYNLTHGDD